MILHSCSRSVPVGAGWNGLGVARVQPSMARKIPATRFLCFVTAAVCCVRAADLSIGGGAGPAAGNGRTDPTGQNAHPQIGGTLLLNAGFDFLRFRNSLIGLELPVAVYGSQSSDLHAYPSSDAVTLYRERLSVAFTPGVRLRLAGDRRFCPWISLGAGLGRIDRTGTIFSSSQSAASQTDSNLVLALAPAVGTDIRLVKRWLVRGELRNYLYRTPANGFVASEAYWNRWNYNPVAAASVVYRFGN